jgi:hypothetical protein
LVGCRAVRTISCILDFVNRYEENRKAGKEALLENSAMSLNSNSLYVYNNVIAVVMGSSANVAAFLVK